MPSLIRVAMAAEPTTARAGANPVRLVVFGASIVSDWGNPAATTTRSVLRALAAAGHDAVFLERRGNRPTVELLRARGGAALRALAARDPMLRYRTYEVPTGAERVLWPGREIATADAVIVQDTAPPELIETIAALRVPRLARIFQATRFSVPPAAEQFDHLLAPPGFAAAFPIGVTPFGPAVDRTGPMREAGSGRVAVVAYGAPDVAARAAAVTAHLRPALVAPGDVGAPGFRYVPEVELGALYRAADVAAVIAGDDTPLAASRLLLPLSYGCASLAVAGGPMPPVPTDAGVAVVRLDDLAAAVESRLQRTGAVEVPSVPRQYTGADHAERLIAIVAAATAARTD